MSATSNSYARGDVNQPQGNRRWCVPGDTGTDLRGESPAVPGLRSESPAVAFRCSGCGVSRVFETTSEDLAAFPAPPAPLQDLVHRDGTYFHCGEPMRPPATHVETMVGTFPGQDQAGAGDSLAAYLATRVLRCRCGFQMEVTPPQTQQLEV